MSGYKSESEKEIIAGALSAGGIGANLIIGASCKNNSKTLQLRDIDDFISFDVAI